jgi:type IV fimbrial biogenesis protein FimT
MGGREQVVRRDNPPVRGSRGRCSTALGKRGRAGFTLIEMLTVLSVLAVLLAVATPGLASLISANALSSAQSELASALVLARSEALKRGASVTVAAAAPVSGAEFSGGWRIYVDSNGNGVYDAGEAIVREQPAFRGDLRLATTSSATTVTFNGRGFLAPATMVTINVCSSSAPKSYQLRIEPVGLADVNETTGCT